MGRRITMAFALSVIAMAALAGAASADPVKAKGSLLVPATCGGQPVVLATNGNGTFTPGHVVGSTAVIVPQSFDLTFSFTPPGGPTESDTNTAEHHNVHGDLVTCDIDFTQTNPDGSSFSLVGSATGFVTPVS